MAPLEKKVAHYHRQWERQTHTSLWFALAIVTIAVVGLGLFFTIASGSGGHAPALTQALRFGRVNADQHAPNTSNPTADARVFGRD
jgi:hypothetical protein